MYRSRGMSLLELLSTLAILGILVTAVSAAIWTGNSAGNYGAKTFAHTLAKDLQVARRRAIKTGNEHYLVLVSSGSSITSCTLYEFDGSSATAVGSIREVPKSVTVTINPSASQTPSFTFEGQTTASFTFTLSGPDTQYSVSVQATTGQPTVEKL